MWPMGHAAVAYILYSLSTRWRGDDSPTAAAVVLAGVGGVLSDLIDKPLAWYLNVIPTGRSLAHSLVVLVPLVAAVSLLSRRQGRAEVGLAFGIGTLSHPLADALPSLWGTSSAEFLLWPLLSVDVPESYPTVLGLLQRSLSDPYFFVELFVLVLALALWRTDGYPGLAVLRRGEQPG